MYCKFKIILHSHYIIEVIWLLTRMNVSFGRMYDQIYPSE